MYINIISPYNNLSYGLVSKNIISNLRNWFDISHFPIGLSEDYKDSDLFFLNKKFNKDAVSLKIFHEFDLLMSIGNGRKIGFPIFEKDRLLPLDLYNIKHCDEIFVCSHWAQNVLNQYSIKSTVIPLGVDDSFQFVNTKFEDKVIFYNLGKREVRKGHDYLHKVFKKAFPDKADVELWMFSQNIFDSKEEKDLFQLEYKKTLGSRVKFFPFLPKSDLISWINKAHIGFFPTRAEGFCLPILEGMKLGKHILATNYSGQTEFLPENQSFSCEKFVEARDNKWFNGGFNWAEVESSEDEIVEKLRSFYKKVKEGCHYNAYNITMASKFSWYNTCEKIRKAICY